MTDAERAPRAWLTIQEASDLLGVSPATLRRWTEAGDLEAFVTPGGHRRFARASILELLPSGPKRRRRLHELGETPEHIVRQYRRELAQTPSPSTWMTALGDTDREAFRGPGRRILGGVLGFLDGATPEESEGSLADALDASRLYGALARERGVGVDVITATFLRFRLPFLDELGRIARRRRLASDEAMDLILAASRVFDRLLLALIDGHRQPDALPVSAATGMRSTSDGSPASVPAAADRPTGGPDVRGDSPSAPAVPVRPLGVVG